MLIRRSFHALVPVGRSLTHGSTRKWCPPLWRQGEAARDTGRYQKESVLLGERDRKIQSERGWTPALE